MITEKTAKYGIIAFTAVVYLLVIVLHEMPTAEFVPEFVRTFPLLNAMINGTCFLLLVLSLLAIKSQKVSLHKLLNTTAMALSVVFLLSYVTYHYFVGDGTYGGDYKGIYYFILITHILLAALSLPFILFAYYRGFIGDLERHKKIVKFTYPIWLYVTLTGVLVYLFMAPYY